MSESKYPEHDKLRAHEAESLTVSDFLDFLQEQKLHLGKYHTHTDDCRKVERKYLCHEITDERQIHVEGRWHRKGEHTEACYYDDVTYTCHLGEQFLYPFDIPTNEKLIGLFLDIDPKKLSAEKDAMYEELRSQARRA